MRAHNQLSGIEADLMNPCWAGERIDCPHGLGRGTQRLPPRSSSSASSFSPSSDSLDVEETHAQPAGLIPDGRVSAASEGQPYKGNISDIPGVMLYDFFITRLFSSRLRGMGYTPTQTPDDSTVDPYPDPMHLWVEVYL